MALTRNVLTDGVCVGFCLFHSRLISSLLTFTDTVCPEDWSLFGDQCIKLSDVKGKFSDKDSICEIGDPFTHFLLKFWMIVCEPKPN